MLTINVAVLLAIILILLLCRPVKPRKRIDQVVLVILAVILGILIAPTGLGQSIANGMNQLALGISRIGW
ncbi:hypothetical protein C3486_01475 [Streptomyces sp. Ru73]|uniref:hypothetical protein n=1 Tax=Streptomyces sp. Ru73 TaxID=2080748 RepID=UPI000CDDBB45|nr:hypothetical protein [Streptomyces sp. Ru73]POX43242.1 hypothetical protein C3486_01475 [Streptomyces sp. Ru73]